MAAHATRMRARRSAIQVLSIYFKSVLLWEPAFAFGFATRTRVLVLRYLYLQVPQLKARMLVDYVHCSQKYISVYVASVGFAEQSSISGFFQVSESIRKSMVDGTRGTLEDKIRMQIRIRLYLF